MSTKEQLNVLSAQLDNAQDSVQDWRALPEDKQSIIMHNAWLALAIQLGNDKFKKMSNAVMHKGSNIVLSETGACGLVSTVIYTMVLYYEVKGCRPKLGAVSDADTSGKTSYLT